MFAVKGWSVSAANLRSEAVDSAAASAASQSAKSRKRKRAKTEEAVTNDNVIDLWEKVIEGKERKDTKRPDAALKSSKQDKANPTEERQKKRQKKEFLPEDTKGRSDAEQSKINSGAETPRAEVVKKSKKAKSNKDEPEASPKHATKSEQTVSSKTAKATARVTAKAPAIAPATAPAAAPAATPVAIVSTPKLTPLQASMREKLVSARFRHLNETLYTRPSAEALQLFAESPDMFTEYHEGFRRQVGVWPENPVDGYIKDIQIRGRIRHSAKGDERRSRQRQAMTAQLGEDETLPAVDIMTQPLPRTRGTCTIADLGCGDAGLATALKGKLSSKMHLQINSYDLHSPSPLVTKADIANLPLAEGSVDLAIFCLALMGTNWLDFIEEAYRILKWKGELWVAEIKSRFGIVGRPGSQKAAQTQQQAGKRSVVEHSVGNRRKGAALLHNDKKAAAKDAAADEAALLIEVDGADDIRAQTDVTAFVQALRRRGFILAGEGTPEVAKAVDSSNRMFVKMRFIKAASATMGKGARQPPAGAVSTQGTDRFGAKKPKFIEDDAQGVVDETKILKPCVYKLR